MKTPYGFECAYFFGDYHRGKNVEECRLIGQKQPPNHWSVQICKNCPVPGILRANACTHMVLRGEIRSGFLGFNRRIQVSAFCTKTNRNVDEPHIGCGECHPLPDIFGEIEN